jgi:SEC-C motif
VTFPNRMPGEITPEILAFCRQLDPTREPVWVPVRASADGTPGNHFANLKGYASRHGGVIRHGWTISKQPGRYLEAEFHGVWVAPSGELVDLATRAEGATRTLFLADSRQTYQGESIPNRFLALSGSPDVRADVQNAEMHARLRADAETQSRRERVRPGAVGRNDPCPCGSGLKHKKCCGK